ncbi:MAG: polysaccharide biosynthesis protein [Anaerolineales bacterium]|nr:polysaccharide biosynthesis protein [Chloroflexota bacterium]MBL6981684.1 polysaccharide biosynthesis protein [Anaerolineales bacterium]
MTNKFLPWLRAVFTNAPIRNRVFLISDIFLIVVSVLGSFALRFELGPLFEYFMPQAIRMSLLAIFIKPLIYWVFGLYRRLWAYASTRELTLVISAVSAASIVLSVAVITMIYFQSRSPEYIGFPRATLVIDWLLSMILVGGMRFISRIVADSRPSAANNRGLRSSARNVLIVGAGDAGALVVREIQKNPQLNLTPVCFLDDDEAKRKSQIHGVPVVGSLDDLSKVVKSRRIQEVIISIPTAPGNVIRQVADICRQEKINFRTMPGMYELIGGRVSVSRLREVNIDDLLRRASAITDDKRIGSVVAGQRILVTGSGGSIGTELCRQIARWGPSALIQLGHGENSIFRAYLELNAIHPNLPIHPVIADIRDSDRLTAVFEELRPQVIFHTAAHKHVPLMEVNVEEAITNNVLGTRNVVETALTYGVERLVMISSDKAIRPTSVMGATKRLAELMVLDAAHSANLAYSAVRFGNVLGSRGSVVPRFQRQIAAGGPVTITHPDMERFFMTIPEAVHLVLHAGAMGKGGEVFVLKMGAQVKILDLAEDLIRLSGLEPGQDIEIIYTGVRPGEKLSEELWDKWASFDPTKHPDILLLSEEDILSGDVLHSAVDDLIHMAREGAAASILKRLDVLIPGASVRDTPPPDLTSLI